MTSCRSGLGAAVLSSEAVGRPRHGLGVHGSSKAALEESMRAWRLEHPEVRFSVVAVGATQPTEFGLNLDMDLLGPTLETWAVHGLMQVAFMESDEVAAVLVGALGSALSAPSVGIEELLLRSPSPVVGDATTATEHAEEVAEQAAAAEGRRT